MELKEQIKLMEQKLKIKQENIIGCEAVFNNEGFLEIFIHSTVSKMGKQMGERMRYLICGFKKGWVFITTDGMFVSKVAEKFVKIIS